MKREETAIDKIANDWVKQLAKRSPSYATYLGFPGGEKDVDDFSPEALEQDRHDYADLISRLHEAIDLFWCFGIRPLDRCGHGAKWTSAY